MEHASFERMQELERSGAFTIDKMKPYDRKNPDSYKVHMLASLWVRSAFVDVRFERARLANGRNT